MMEECLICFIEYPIKDFIKCFLPNCKSKICYQCTKTHIDLCGKENKIPKCLYCLNYMLQKSIINYPELIPKYNECCIKEMTREKAFELSENIALHNKIEEIREIRKIFIENKFPAAIAYVAEHFLSHKVKKINNRDLKKKKKKTDIMPDKNVQCMNLICKGYLDSNFKCMICDTIFCKSCESIMLENHQCKEEDLASMITINEFVKCPKCSLPVEKSSGCDIMKCSYCSENFIYSTGKSGGLGNNHNSQLLIRENIYLSIEYNKLLEQKGLLSQIRILEDQKPNEEIRKLNNSLKKYLKSGTPSQKGKNNNSENVLINNVARDFQKHIINTIKIKNYNKLMITLEQEIKKQTLDLKKFSEIIDSYELRNDL